MRTVSRKRNEHGAALVEFAIAMPLLIILLLGMVEFGWLFGQYNAVRHGAREAGRFAAVNGGIAGGIANADVADRACTAIQADSAGMTQMVVTSNNGGGDLGDNATVTVVADVSSFTGLFGGMVPQLTSSATFRMEKDASWSSGAVTFTNPGTCT